MKPLRSVGARLSLALAAVVAIALGVVWLIVVPSLERNLTQARLDQLSRAAALTFQTSLPSFPFDIADFVVAASEATNARVVYMQPLVDRAPPLSVIEDSRGLSPSAEIAEDPLAIEASQELRAERGFVTRAGERYAEVAIPAAFDGSVYLFSSSLEDTLANVRLVKRRLLAAGAVALFVALLLGYGGASVFARRLRRLERAADRIAGGRLDEPVIDRGADEVGELARAFERMRGRLAQLEHARREFIANASHELRTPIFSLGGFLELMANEDLDEATRREFLGTMQEQVERLTKLATDLLDLSRLDAGQLQLELEAVDLARLGESLAEEFTAVALSTGHPLEATSEEAASLALADEQRARQIGRVLVENALRHTPPGTPVRVGARRDRRHVLLTVEDEGPGIPAEHADHVFERFYRLEGTRASGSGLGLAIARELAELMGGTLELVSRPGRTAVSLRLPAAPAREEPPRRAPATRVAA